MQGLTAVVLAAGHGKRMKSDLTKVMHSCAGRPLIHYPIQAALDAGAGHVVLVTGPHNREVVESYAVTAFGASRVTTVVQDPPRGTGDAVRAALPALASAEQVVILCGDTPLIQGAQLEPLLDGLRSGPDTALAFLTCRARDPRGYGRVLRDASGVVREVREQRDLSTPEQHAITEINAGVYAVTTSLLGPALTEVRPANAQGEYYLTDVVAIASRVGLAVAVETDAEAMIGVNDRAQLCLAEDRLYRRIAEQHALRGVTVRGDVRIDDTVCIGVDATIEHGVCLRGQTRVEAGATIDVGSVITDSRIGRNATIKPYCVIVASSVGQLAQIGPFAHMRSDSIVEERAQIGNFVETKKTRMGAGAKANHLAYLGDGVIGKGANIGAGTIFCNYDGSAKHTTVVGENVFIGSDSQLVAPVTIGSGAYVATGTTVTKDVPDDALAIARVKQENKPGYASRLRARLQVAAREKSAGAEPSGAAEAPGEAGRKDG